MLPNTIAIAVGAALGANLRYWLTLWAAERFGVAFPYGTLLINLVGSLGIGLVYGVAEARPLPEQLRLLLITGLLGGFTTFSTFSYETYALLLAGRWAAAGAYVLASVALGLLAVLLGVGLVRLAV